MSNGFFVPPVPPVPSKAPPKAGQSKPHPPAKDRSWNDPERIDSAFGWLVLAVVGGIVFMMMGQNLIPYWDYFGAIASRMFEPWRGRFLLWILPLGGVYWLARIAGGVLGVALFSSIQYMEIRPQLLLNGTLPSGPKRNGRLMAAFVFALVALAIDCWFCFLFWPPINSPLGWAVFRAGFSWSLVNKWNMIRTGFTLFGGMIFIFVRDYLKKNW